MQRLSNPVAFCLVGLHLACMAIADRPRAPQRPLTTTLVAFGDINLGEPVASFMKRMGNDFPFRKIASRISSADIAFANLECAVSTRGKPVPKKYNFRAQPSSLQTLRKTGFDVLSLANNHTWDYGRLAIQDTLSHVTKAGMLGVGAGESPEAAHELRVIRRNGIRIGFLAYVGLLPPVIPEAQGQPSVAVASAESIRSEVRLARRQVDILVVSLHAGVERSLKPAARQRRFAEAAVDAGADLVIGHHPHVVQPMETYKGKTICYSLGNFVFSAEGRGGGAMLQATLHKNGLVVAQQIVLSLKGGQPSVPSVSGKSGMNKKGQPASRSALKTR